MENEEWRVEKTSDTALNRGEENLDRINKIYRIITDKIVIIVSILSIILSIFRHFAFPRFNVVLPENLEPAL